MVAGDIDKRNVQKGDDVFKIWIRQVSAPNDQFDITEMTVVAETIEPFDDFITDSKYFHCAVILP